MLFRSELARFEKMQRTDVARKFSASHKSPSHGMTDNIFVNWLETNVNFKDKSNKRNVGWQNDQDLISKIYYNIRNEKKYKEYYEKESPTLEEQVEFCRWVIQFAKGYEVFAHAMEEKNIFWAESLDLIISMVSKTISGFDVSNLGKNKLMEMYRDTEDDLEFMKKLLSSTITNDELFTGLISEKTKNWDVERIALMDVLLLKMALAEVVCFESIPVKVTINEYLDIAKIYSTPKSNIFINGVIDKLVADLKTQGKIHKTGRGLVE